MCGNASYHSRVLNSLPNSPWKKQLFLDFMRSHGILVPVPVPIIPVLLQIIIGKLPMSERKQKYGIYQMAASCGHVVLSLRHIIVYSILLKWFDLKLREKWHLKISKVEY